MITGSHLRLVPPVMELTAQEKQWQRTWVELADRLSGLSQERRDEEAAQSRAYTRARGNVIQLRRDPQPPRPAA